MSNHAELLAELGAAAKAPSKVGASSMATLLARAIAAVEEAPDVWVPDPDAGVHERVLRVMAAIGAVGKTAEMTEGPRYNYRSIDSILERAHPAMARFGLLIVPTVQGAEYEDKLTANKKPMVAVHLTVEWNVHGLKGDRLEPPLVTVGEAFDTSDKATNKAHTAAFKLALGLLFAIPYSEPDQDDERHELGAEEEQESSEPPTPEEEAAVAALLELIDHAPDELVGPWTEKYHSDVWQGQVRSWEECPPRWAPIILRGARKRLAEWEAEQEDAGTGEVNGALVPSVLGSNTQDTADPTVDHGDAMIASGGHAQAEPTAYESDDDGYGGG